MIGLAVADLHIRSTNPQYRIDDYPIAILKKVSFIISTANRYKASIFIAGDIFDNVRVGYKYTNKLIKILRKAKYGIYTIPGQHDQEHHEQDMEATPYQTLIESGVIHDVNNIRIDGIFGIGWESSRPEDETSGDVLIMHYCVTPNEPPFFLKDSASSAFELSNRFSNWKTIICGDYHIPHIFVNKMGNKCNNLLINCGSIGRSNKDQWNHKPRVVLFDTKRPGIYKNIFIPVESSEKVFNIPDDIPINEEFSAQIKELAGELLSKNDRPTFGNTVKFIMQKSMASKRKIDIARKFISIGNANNGSTKRVRRIK